MNFKIDSQPSLEPSLQTLDDAAVALDVHPLFSSNAVNTETSLDLTEAVTLNFKTVPTLYLEPRMLMVDDDASFLDAIGDLLCDMMSVETSLDPRHVIEQLKNNQTLQRLVQDCIEASEDSSDHTDVIYLNYKNLAQKLYAYYLSNDFISVVCIDYRMPAMNGLDVARELKGLILSRILLTADIEVNKLLSAYDEGIITKLIRKTEDDLECVIEDTVNKEHFNIINDLNTSLFGSFINHSAYAALFSYPAFIRSYQSILFREKIVFSCVYESGGSLIMLCRDGTSYLFNIYSDTEIQHYLFQSEAYEKNITSTIKEKVERFELIVDYKTNDAHQGLGDLSKTPLTASFSKYTVNDITYFVVFRKNEAGQR